MADTRTEPEHRNAPGHRLVIGWMACLAAVALLVAGCSGQNDSPDAMSDNPPGDTAGTPGRNTEEPAAQPRRLRDPWLRAQIGEVAAYRLYLVPGDEDSAREERWVVHSVQSAETPPTVRRYTGGGLGPLGLEAEVAATVSVAVPPRSRGIVAENWWLSDAASVDPAAELASHTLPSGQRLAVLPVPLDGGGTVWVSETAPIDGVVRVADAEGRVLRELLAVGPWLGLWVSEDGETVVALRGTEARLNDERFASTVAESAADGTVTLALTAEDGTAAGTLTLTPQPDGTLHMTDGNSTQTKLMRQ